MLERSTPKFRNLPLQAMEAADLVICKLIITRAYYGMECKSSIFHSRQNLPYNSIPYLNITFGPIYNAP